MLTPVFSVSAVALKYDALLAASVAVSYLFSGNLTTWLLTQVGSNTATTMRNAPSPASTSPMCRRIDPPGKRECYLSVASCHYDTDRAGMP